MVSTGRDGETHLLGGGDNALGDHVALHDAAEDVDQNGLNPIVRRDDLEGGRDLVHLGDGGEMVGEVVWGDGVGRWRGEMVWGDGVGRWRGDGGEMVVRWWGRWWGRWW